MAKSGHGCSLYVTLDPVGAPTTFTRVSEVDSDFMVGFSRGETEVTPHNSHIDEWVVDNYVKRDAFTFKVNMNDDETQDEDTGIQGSFWKRSQVKSGFWFLRPNETMPTGGYLMSGQVTAFKITSPIRTGVQSADVTVRMSGAQKINGVLFDGSSS